MRASGTPKLIPKLSLFVLTVLFFCYGVYFHCYFETVRTIVAENIVRLQKYSTSEVYQLTDYLSCVSNNQLEVPSGDDLKIL